jgi:hypothetical protein
MPSDNDLDELIERITVDAYGDEGYWCFLQAIEDETKFPIPATLVGVPVHVTSIDFDGNERRGLIATVERDGHSTAISVLDIELPASEQATAQVIAAYKHWLGII